MRRWQALKLNRRLCVRILAETATATPAGTPGFVTANQRFFAGASGFAQSLVLASCTLRLWPVGTATACSHAECTRTQRFDGAKKLEAALGLMLLKNGAITHSPCPVVPGDRSDHSVPQPPTGATNRRLVEEGWTDDLMDLTDPTERIHHAPSDDCGRWDSHDDSSSVQHSMNFQN